MRLNKQNTVIVETIGDIRRVVQEFLPSVSENNPVVTKKIMADGKTYEVSAPTSCTYKEMLLEGFTILKKRYDAMEKIKERVQNNVTQPISMDGHMWLDDLISRRLGGKRDGLRVKWDVKDGTYYYDPFTGKLTKAE